MMSVGERLGTVLAAVFRLPDGLPVGECSSQTVPDWDSVGHIKLIMALEEEFEVQFDPDDIGDLSSYAVIHRRLSEGAGC